MHSLLFATTIYWHNAFWKREKKNGFRIYVFFDELLKNYRDQQRRQLQQLIGALPIPNKGKTKLEFE